MSLTSGLMLPQAGAQAIHALVAYVTEREADPLTAAALPAWAPRPAPPRRRRTVARDLVASVDRFNRRWVRLVESLRLDSVNRQVEHYNRYYVLEKECVIGSARLAARHFTPRPLVTPALLLADHPTLPTPVLAS